MSNALCYITFIWREHMRNLKNILLTTVLASMLAVFTTSANAKCKARLGDLFLKKDMDVKFLLQKEVLLQ